MKQSKTAVQSGLRGAKAALKYIIVSLSAVLTAVILSVLFSVTAVSDGEAGLTGGGFVVALKPAYLFSVPVEGDLVIYEGESSVSGGRSLKTGVYDGEEIPMEQVRERFSPQCRGPLNKTKASDVLFYRRRKVGLTGSSPLSLQSASEKQERRFLRQGEEKKALSRAGADCFRKWSRPASGGRRRGR